MSLGNLRAIRTSLRIFKVKFLTCKVFACNKNLLCRLRSSCLRHDVNCKQRCNVQVNTKLTV